MPEATFVKPQIPGSVLTFTGVSTTRVAPSFADVVGLVGTADWGPLGSDAPGTDGKRGGPQFLSEYADYEALFGTGDSQGRTAVLGAFAGQGLDGQGGAGGVYFHRVGTGAALATINIPETAAGPNAIRLDGVYKGTRGNSISYAIEADPALPATNDRLRVLFGGVTVERYSFARAGSKQALVDQINVRPSKYVKATLLGTATGAALATTAGTALAGGTDGAAPSVLDLDDALQALQFKPFGILAPANVTDPAQQAVFVSWVQAQEAANRPVRLVVGGAAAEDLTAALARTASIGDPHVVNFGVGTYHDDLLDKDLSTAQLAPRIAGILAARGETKALTFAEIAGLSIAAGGPAADELRTAIDGGVTVLMEDSMPNAELRIVQGVTTFTAKNIAGRPYDVYSEPRFIGIMDTFTRGMRQFGNDIVIGDLPVNDDTRALVRKELSRRISDLLSRGLIEPGDKSRGIDPPSFDVPRVGDPDLLDAVPYTFGWQFTRTANYVIGNGTVK